MGFFSGSKGTSSSSSSSSSSRSPFRRDSEVVFELYRSYPHPSLLETTFTNDGDTLLHLAASHRAEDILAEAVGLIGDVERETYERILSIKNKRGDTPLHCAAAMGALNMCKCITSDERYYSLVHIRNNRQETPLFLAALNGHKETFLYLHWVSDKCATSSVSGSPWRRARGETILHCTLEREYFDLSLQIIHLYNKDNIANAINERGRTPLHVLAGKPTAFKSGTSFRWWKKLMYHCAVVEALIKVDKIPTEEIIKTYEDNKNKKPVDKHMLPPNYLICPLGFALLRNAVLTFMNFFWDLAGFSDTKKIKEKHAWSSQILDELVEVIVNYEYWADGTNPAPDTESNDKRLEVLSLAMEDDTLKSIVSSYNVKNGNRDQQNEQDVKLEKEIVKKKETMTVLLTAAKNGVLEIVEKMLNSFSGVINEMTTENKNILLVAAENKQPHIIEAMRKQDIWDSLIRSVDNEGNNVLHLAAKASTHMAWQIAGSAMQMQWEVKWYEFVKDIVPQHIIFQPNNEEAIPGEIFTESHRELVKDAGDWLKSTSESCSVVAALIAGVSFATNSSVPGGTNDQTGVPNLARQPAFNVFAVTSLAALCFSVTALVMFLAILTSRHQPSDFRRDLPLKLILGLSSLFVSIASMLVSFCAAYFFVLRAKMHNMEFIIIIYCATCLPVTFYAVAQFPLYWDLLRAIFTKVPQPTHRE